VRKKPLFWKIVSVSRNLFVDERAIGLGVLLPVIRRQWIQGKKPLPHGVVLAFDSSCGDLRSLYLTVDQTERPWRDAIANGVDAPS
jgi:hypothetical protein